MPVDPIRPTDNSEQSTTPNEPHLFVLPARVAIESPLYVRRPQVSLARYPDHRCIFCHAPGTYAARVQELMLRIEQRVVLVPVVVETCEVCGECVLDGPTADYLDGLSARLRRGDLDSWESMGTLYRVAGEPFCSSEA